MAVIRDVMPAFELLQPVSVADAQKLLEEHGRDAWVMAGGLDSFDWLKDRIKKPSWSSISAESRSCKGVRTTGDGIEIGAMTTLTEVVNHPIIKEQFGLLAEAAELGRLAADPQPGHHRRQRVAGHALLVLPRRLALLPCRRQHLLCRHTEAATASTRFCGATAAWR